MILDNTSVSQYAEWIQQSAPTTLPAKRSFLFLPNLQIYYEENILLPRTLTLPINIHKTAHNTPRIDIIKNPLLLPACLLVTLLSGPATSLFLAFNLTLLKLDIRSNARFTKGFSDAEAGVVGIDSTKAHKEEENQLDAPPPPSWPFCVWFASARGCVNSCKVPKTSKELQN